MKYCVVCGGIIEKQKLEMTKYGPKHKDCCVIGHESFPEIEMRRKVITKPLVKGV